MEKFSEKEKKIIAKTFFPYRPDPNDIVILIDGKVFIIWESLIKCGVSERTVYNLSLKSTVIKNPFNDKQRVFEFSTLPPKYQEKFTKAYQSQLRKMIDEK